ncbi:MAG: phage tail protein [Brevirhabdus sp.]
MKSRILTAAAAALLTGLGLSAPQKAHAQSDPFLGQVSLFGYTFCPRGWTEANGALLAISQNSALFSLYGTTYGGDGRTTFGLPDLRGRAPIGQGQGPALQSYTLGSRGGAESFTLTAAEMPSHNHLVNVTNQSGDRGGPAGDFLAVPFLLPTSSRLKLFHNGPANKTMDPAMIGNTGGGQAVNKRSPYLTMRWCVAVQGIFPSRN